MNYFISFSRALTNANTDYSTLLEKISSLQEEKWSAEQKLQMLEHSATAMADDLVKKSNLIQFYCMEGKQGMDFLQKWFFKVLAALNDLLQESHL